MAFKLFSLKVTTNKKDCKKHVHGSDKRAEILAVSKHGVCFFLSKKQEIG